MSSFFSDDSKLRQMFDTINVSGAEYITPEDADGIFYDGLFEEIDDGGTDRIYKHSFVKFFQNLRTKNPSLYDTYFKHLDRKTS